MIQPGNTYTSDSGRRIRVRRQIRAGTQGQTYLATDTKSGSEGVLKSFKPKFVNAETIERLRYLIKQDLPSECPAIFAPIDLVLEPNVVAHYTPFATGKLLEEHLQEPEANFLQSLQLATALAHAVATLHRRGIAHADLHSENVIVDYVGTAFRLRLIDLDNYAAAGLPKPPCVGQQQYMAPELRKALAENREAVPTIGTDLFPLGVLMHEIILLRSLCAGSESTTEEFEKAMCLGKWLQDPAAPDRPKAGLGGYPVEVLNAGLTRLFRSSVSLDPASRPSAETWEQELGRAMNAVYCCPSCGGPCLIDVSKTICPYPTKTISSGCSLRQAWLHSNPPGAMPRSISTESAN